MYSSTATGNTSNFGYNPNSYNSTSPGTNTAYSPIKRTGKSKHDMSNMDCEPESSSYGMNSPSKRPSPGVFNCQTCNALFTCLQYYQQHRKHHAECDGSKLLCCNHCPYSTVNNFHYNWHIMSHSGDPPHECSVCSKPEETESTLPNHIKVEADEDDPPSCSMSGKRSVATATTDDLLLLGTTTPRRYSTEKEHEETPNHYVPEHYSPPSLDYGNDGNHVSCYTQASDDEVNQEESVMQLNGASTQDDDISDDDDDDEEEVESEEDDGEERDYGMSESQQDMNQNYDNVIQGPPYTKSPNALPGEVPSTPPRGKGKGNRKSRIISGSQDGSDGDESGSGIRRKFHCSHCGKSFKTKSHLQRHILTHTGEKPYHCNRCGSKFNQSSSLRNHIIAIHTKEYPHYCDFCKKGFLMPALLQKHMATSHRNK
ncbi:Zinc finger protein 27 [Halotydeus destructor]|nr:Zinc finger protein 27 [Halotydeus destructor]